TYQKLTQAILSFRNSIPLIERLKTDAMKPQHWRHLMELAGCEFEVDSKKFKLQNVFDLDLSRFPDQVQNVLQTAQVGSQNTHHFFLGGLLRVRRRPIWERKRLPFLKKSRRRSQRLPILS
ncbi:dynein heavy chain family protein, partial [Toxoplasma gondii RUB]